MELEKKNKQYMSKIIPYGKQYINSADFLSVEKSLKKPLITTGKFVKKFEDKISKFLGVNYVATSNNATSALHLSFLATDIKKNDIIIMPIINFIASYSMCKILGAKIYFADVDKSTGQITPDTITECIKINKLKNIKAIVVQCMGGYPENSLEFFRLKNKLKCLLIEDACHAFGAKYFYKKRLIMVGSCKHADASVFSFHPLKPITTGEGGCVTTNNKKVYNKLIKLRSHGIERNKLNHWNYDVKMLGYNYRLSDINCALGLSQLGKLKKFINRRKTIYNYYKKNLDGYRNMISFPNYRLRNNPSFHLILVNFNFKNLKQKDKFLNYMKKNDILCQYHYIPLNKLSVVQERQSKIKNYKEYYLKTISIPIYHSILLKELKYVVKKIKQYF